MLTNQYTVRNWGIPEGYFIGNALKIPNLDMHVKITDLTLKHRETHGCVVSTVATDALVLKHQAISIHNAD